MKKLLLAIAMFFFFIPLFSQSEEGDSCIDPGIVGPGVHYVENINGEHFGLNCSEYDADNEELEWYMYTPSADYLTTITADLDQNEGLDTRFHVYEGSCDNLSCVAGDDDSGSGYLSVTSFYAYAGVSYYIAWDDRWGTESFDFEIIEEDPPPPPPFNYTCLLYTSPSPRD